jgi:hypothetical protein
MNDRLYALLPSIYRQRDLAEGSPLRALLGAIEQELLVIENDIETLYDNWFIETCQEWVVPYIGDLLGVRGLSDAKHLLYSQRGRVANTLNARRRKGVPQSIAQAVRDSSGWQASVVEYFNLVTASQQVQHIRWGLGGTVDIREREAIGCMDRACDTLPRRPDLRRIASHRGRHNAGNVGIFVRRLQVYPLTSSARPALAGCYYISTLGRDLPLFKAPGPALTQDAMLSVPDALTRVQLAKDLREPASVYYGPERALNILRNGQSIPPREIISADLSDWASRDTLQWGTDRTMAIDVQTGRLCCKDADAGATVEVSYHYAFSADLGGGPYSRLSSLARPQVNTWIASVAQTAGVEAEPSAQTFTTLTDAIKAWVQAGQLAGAIIEIMDQGSYEMGPEAWALPTALTVQAADGMRPTLLVGTGLVVSGTQPTAGLTLNGLLIDGAIEVDGTLNLTLQHCTVSAGIKSGSTLHELQLKLNDSLCGPLRLPADGVSVDLQDSIVDGFGESAIAGASATTAFGPIATISRCTMLGPVLLRELTFASEAIFNDTLRVERIQRGGARFCYIPDGSITPQRYRCQPDLAFADPLFDQSAVATTLRRLQPQFTSTLFLAPAYAQLRRSCAEEIRRGAEDGGEMGVFHRLHQAEREVNLLNAVTEQLPAGLEAGVFFVN